MFETGRLEGEDFVSPLKDIQRRHRLQLFIHAALWSGAAIALGLALIRVFPVAGLSFAGWGLAIVVPLVGLGFFLARMPDLRQAAQKTDASLGLDQHFSSALEVRQDWRRYEGPVALALLRDAGMRARIFDLKKLAPLLPRQSLTAGGALLIALALLLAASLLLPHRPAASTAPILPEAAPMAQGATVEDVEVMADLVADAARRRDEDALRSVAKELKALAQEAGQGLSQTEFDQRLSKLVDDASRAFDGSQPAWMPNTPGDLSGMGERMSAYQAELAEQNLLNSEMPMDSIETLRQLAAIEEEDALAAQSKGSPIPLGPDGSSLGQSAATLDGKLPDGVAPPPPIEMFAPSPMEQQVIDAAGAAPAGASMQSGKGESNMAGMGNQPLAPNDAFTALGAPKGQDMTLTAAESNQGGRIRIQVAPDTEAGAGDSQHSANAISGNEHHGGEAVVRETVNPADLAVVARYFSPLGLWAETEQ